MMLIRKTYETKGTDQLDMFAGSTKQTYRQLERIQLQGCRFGPESKPKPGNQYLDP